MTKHTRFADHDQLPREQVVALAGELVQQRLKGAPVAVAKIAGHLAGSMGKGIRTHLLVACATDGDDNAPYGAAKAAAAVEVLHLATLVHDDIIDDALTRRGIASVQSKFGKKQAVICGDWLLCVAMNLAVGIRISEQEQLDNWKLAPSYAHALEQVCLGELNQSVQNGNVELSAYRYLRIVSQKTAALFYLSAYAGATLGKCDETERKALVRFAQYLGMVFQIVDDIKDYMLDEVDALKPVKSDLLTGVITLPLIISFATEPGLKSLAQAAMGTGQGIGELIAKVRDGGGVEGAQATANRYGEKAEKLLEQVRDPQKQRVLSDLMDHALQAAKKF